MKTTLFFLLLLSAISLFGQQKNEIVTIGCFHFHLVSTQFGVHFDVQDKKVQADLDTLALQIARYQPTKIFVEWAYDKQGELDTLYNLYREDKTIERIKEQYGQQESMYFNSEVQQLGFRIAAKAGHHKVFAFDYPLPEPNDTIIATIQKSHQLVLMGEIQNEFSDYSQDIIAHMKTAGSVKEMLLFFNNPVWEQRLNSGNISLFNKVGTINDFSGAYFVSERYRRNLYMYSLIQKQVAPQGERILVIAGVQHAAGMRAFILNDRNFKSIDLGQILK